MALAAHRGDVAEVRRLLDAGADPNQRDPSGSTPLMAAARGGHFPGPHQCGGQSPEHLATIRALLAAGANPELTDRNGWTAKIVAEHHRQAESAARLARGR